MTDFITSFLSFDVEALPARSKGSPVDELIWGRMSGGEYGISRICDVLEQHKLRGNFLVDFSACLLYGDRAIQQVVDFLLSRGHEVHTHLHSEWVTRKWNVPGAKDHMLGMDRMGEALSDALMQYAAYKCHKLLGRVSTVFRSGAFVFNDSTIRAAKRAGFAALSNYNYGRHGEFWLVPPEATTNDVFAWPNGVIELPVDYSPEPLSTDWKFYESWLARVKVRKAEKTNNLVMHSWSLLHREGEQFERFSPEHEERLHRICERVKADGEVLTYDEYLTRREERATPTARVPWEFCRSASVHAAQGTSCNLCGHFFAEVPETDVCPTCGGRTRHRQVQDVMQRIGNPLNGKVVLATFANESEKLAFLSGVAALVNFDVRPVEGLDVQMDVQDMNLIQDGQFDAFFSIHVLNHVKDDQKALAEIYRVLKPGGLAFITLPYREQEETTELTDVTVHYGQDALEKYGVGSYRRYGFEDAKRMFAKHFELRAERGVDPISQESMYAFLLTKPRSAVTGTSGA
jgi:SAM-dependent methyltransferase